MKTITKFTGLILIILGVVVFVVIIYRGVTTWQQTLAAVTFLLVAFVGDLLYLEGRAK